MSKLTKNQKSVADKVEAGKVYTLKEASELVKEITTTKFEASLDIDVRLGVDPRKANQMVRGVVTLPNGTGKTTRVLVLCTPDQESAAKEAGADYVGLDEYIAKINGGWTDVDVINYINICPASIDLCDIFIKTNIISSSFFSCRFLIWSTENQYTCCFTSTIRKSNNATNHLIRLTWIYS